MTGLAQEPEFKHHVLLIACKLKGARQDRYKPAARVSSLKAGSPGERRTRSRSYASTQALLVYFFSGSRGVVRRPRLREPEVQVGGGEAELTL